MKQEEHHLQVSVMRFLDVVLPDDARAFHVPNGGRRDGRTGARLKREGVKAGVPDIVIVMGGGRCAMIELKADKGRLSSQQKEWAAWCEAYKLPYALCRSLPEVAAALRGFGVALKINGLA